MRIHRSQPQAASNGLILLRIILLAALCFTLAPTPGAAQSKEFFLKAMTGVWDGELQFRHWSEHIFLTIGPDGAFLEVRSRINAGSTPLTVDKVERDGRVVFTFRPQSDETPSNAAYRELNRPTLTSGRFVVKLERPADDPTPYLYVHALFPDKTNGRTATLRQPPLPGPDAERFFIENWPRVFAYQDWRARNTDGPADPIERLKRMFMRLDGEGKWNCLAQRSMTVSRTATTTFKMSEGRNTLYVIYSPRPESGLTYGVASQPPIMGLVRGQTYDYPLVLTNHRTFFESDTTLTFYLRPPAPGVPAAASVPVTVFTFSNSMGSYGGGCSLDDPALTPAPASVEPTAAPISPSSATPAPTPRRGTAAPAGYADRRLESLEKARGIEQKCEVLLTWLNRLVEEFPQVQRAQRLQPADGMGLFREPDFSQVFGRSFEQLSTKARADIHEDVIAKCQGARPQGRSWRDSLPQVPGRRPQAPMTAYVGQFGIYKPLLDGPFLGLAGSFSPQAVIAAVAAARAAREWMDATISGTGAGAAPSASFEAIDRQIADGRTRLAVLWPSEREHFTTALTQRKAAIAGAALQTWIQRLDTFGSTLPDVRRLADERAAQRALMQAADERFKASEQDAYAAKRRRMLNEALPEWQRQLEAFERNDASEARVQAATNALAELFPADAQNDAEYRAYHEALTARVERWRAADQSAAAGACDRAAAHPHDPEATAAGVTDEVLAAQRVIAACEPAVKAKNAAPRLAFQLARGYLKAGRIEQAIEQLVPAAREGHGGALAYLADLHLEGVPGIEADPATAHALFTRAVEAGYAPAKQMLREFDDLTALQSEIEAAGAGLVDDRTYNAPGLVEPIVAGNPDGVTLGEIYSKAYLINMMDTIAGECPAQIPAGELQRLRMAAFQTSANLSVEGVKAAWMEVFERIRMMTQEMPEYIARQAPLEQDVEELPIKALQDAFLLKSRTDCGTAGMAQFLKHAAAYITNEDAPKLDPDRLMSVCSYNAKPAGRFGTRSFCECFVPASMNVAMSRAERKGLGTAAEFWNVAQVLMERDPSRFRLCSSTPPRGR